MPGSRSRARGSRTRAAPRPRPAWWGTPGTLLARTSWQHLLVGLPAGSVPHARVRVALRDGVPVLVASTPCLGHAAAGVQRQRPVVLGHDEPRDFGKGILFGHGVNPPRL